MKKRFLFRELLLSLGLFATMAPLSSCGMFFGGTDYTIANVEQTVDQSTGDTIITITFNDSSITPLEIRIPQVTDGVGISNIITEVNGENLSLIISYTDDSKPDTTINIPILSGKDGVGISDVNVGEDADGNTTLQFFYTNGTSSELFVIPKAIDGKDGVGIESITQTPNGDGTYTIEIIFTDPEKEHVFLTINDGVSIIGTSYNEEASTDEVYALNIYFSDGNQTIVYLPKPQVVSWLTGFSDPKNSDGKNNDFYINLVSGNVYKKNNGSWDYLFCMKGSGQESDIAYYTVRFNLKDDEFTDDYVGGSTIIFNVKEMDYLPYELIPFPTKEGHVFLGRFTTSENNPNSGQFTDTTLVNKDFDLYARWQEI